jgi:hypothetical protein
MGKPREGLVPPVTTEQVASLYKLANGALYAAFTSGAV